MAVLIVALGDAGVAFLKGGYVGVDVLFVLSGFLITGLLLSTETAPSRSRISTLGALGRILPAAALTLVA